MNAEGGPNHLDNHCDAALLATPNAIQDNKTDIGIYPKQYLSHGIVVQPMYYYMGHISRHIRPGSKSLMSIVNSLYSTKDKIRTFRPKGQLNSGGGNNYNARIGIEVTTWPCEGSTRQAWSFDNDRLFVMEEKVYDFDGDDERRKLCLSNIIDPYYHGILLTDCDSTNAATLKMEHYDDGDYDDDKDTYSKIKFQLQNNKGSNKMCLDVSPVTNSGGTYGERGGMQTIFRDCDDSVRI